MSWHPALVVGPSVGLQGAFIVKSPLTVGDVVRLGERPLVAWPARVLGCRPHRHGWAVRLDVWSSRKDVQPGVQIWVEQVGGEPASVLGMPVWDEAGLVGRVASCRRPHPQAPELIRVAALGGPSFEVPRVSEHVQVRPDGVCLRAARQVWQALEA